MNSLQVCLLVGLVFTLTACAGMRERQADTREWKPVSCSTFLQPWNTCAKEALAICPNGYDIYNPVYSPGEQLRKMEIACK